MSQRISKTISYILRHKPEDYGLTLDAQGWVDVQKLVDSLQINIPTLVGIVNSDSKGRYEFSSDGKKLRATQGHSIPVDLSLKVFISENPFLYHGTASRFLSDILSDGLTKQSRNFVHLSQDYDTALVVGGRHGAPVVLQVDFKQMQLDGHVLYVSSNDVVLTDHVPAKYIKVL